MPYFSGLNVYEIKAKAIFNKIGDKIVVRTVITNFLFLVFLIYYFFNVKLLKKP